MSTLPPASSSAPREPPTRAPRIAPEEAAAAQKAEWSQRGERGSIWLLRLFAWIALRLGRGVARALLIPIVWYFFFFGGPARRASRDYMRRVLPHVPLWRDGFRHVFYFAAATLDRIYLLNGRYDLFDLQVHGGELLDSAAQPGMFVLGAHMGSFEAARAAGHRKPGAQVALLMYEDNARKISALLNAINPKAAQEIIALGKLDAMLRLRDRLDQGAVVGLLADRTLADDERLAVPFLGQDAHFPVGPFRIAAMLRRPVRFMVGIYTDPNRYDIHFEPIFDFSSTELPREQAIRCAVETYAARLEHYCRTYPFNWFNFYDFWEPPRAP